MGSHNLGHRSGLAYKATRSRSGVGAPARPAKHASGGMPTNPATWGSRAAGVGACTDSPLAPTVTPRAHLL